MPGRTTILDCHSHRQAPYPAGIVCRTPDAWHPLPGQLYSVGIHPWNIPDDPAPLLERLAVIAAGAQVAAVGETGLDALRGAPMWWQLKVFKAHAELAEELCKPLVVHNVRCAQQIVQLRREWSAAQPWVVHGFRGRPSLLEMLLDAGCAVSYGERFNAGSVRLTPCDRLLAETDDSQAGIAGVVALLAEASGEEDIQAFSGIVAANTARIFNIDSLYNQAGTAGSNISV